MISRWLIISVLTLFILVALTFSMQVDYKDSPQTQRQIRSNGGVLTYSTKPDRRSGILNLNETGDSNVAPRRVTGCINIGNTCYCSAAVQLLMHHPLIDRVDVGGVDLRDKYREHGLGGPEVAQLIATVFPTRVVGRQEDAHEFAIAALNIYLPSDARIVTNRRITCCSCGHARVNNEESCCLILDPGEHWLVDSPTDEIVDLSCEACSHDKSSIRTTVRVPRFVVICRSSKFAARLAPPKDRTLVAIVHQGMDNFGHYVAVVQSRGYHLVSDASVRPISDSRANNLISKATFVLASTGNATKTEM